MHSFQPSRGRILFEFVCALGIVASCVGAWKQTGASALLLAAFVAGLYGFVHLFDMRRPRPVHSADQPAVESAPEQQADIRAFLNAVGPEPVADGEPPFVEPAVARPSIDVEPAAEGELVEPVAVEPTEPELPKPRRKGGSRRPKTVEEAVVVEMAAAEPIEIAPVADLQEEPASPWPVAEEETHPHIAPLFEPEPFARMPRPAFGRRGRI